MSNSLPNESDKAWSQHSGGRMPTATPNQIPPRIIQPSRRWIMVVVIAGFMVFLLAIVGAVVLFAVFVSGFRPKPVGPMAANQVGTNAGPKDFERPPASRFPRNRRRLLARAGSKKRPALSPAA
jgi:hypothetical protein